MIVAKFGGSSVAHAEALKSCLKVIEKHSDIAVVVVSATQKTTNELERCAFTAMSEEGLSLAKEGVTSIFSRHLQIVRDLDLNEDRALLQALEALREEALMLVSGIALLQECPPPLFARVYGLGEKISSRIIYSLLEKQGYAVDFWQAEEIIATDETFLQANPIEEEIKKRAEKKWKEFQSQKEEKKGARKIVLTQGFIGKTLHNRPTILGREGSDYTATLLGAALKADLVQIWTDVAGVYQADPRWLSEAKRFEKLNAEDAGLMTGLGAKVLFPRTLWPLKALKIPLFVGNTFAPEAGGSTITFDGPPMRDIALTSSAQMMIFRLSPKASPEVGLHIKNQWCRKYLTGPLFPQMQLEFSGHILLAATMPRHFVEEEWECIVAELHPYFEVESFYRQTLINVLFFNTENTAKFLPQVLEKLTTAVLSKRLKRPFIGPIGEGRFLSFVLDDKDAESEAKNFFGPLLS
jgi:aspartate kinase